jgi:hypothetical protein
MRIFLILILALGVASCVRNKNGQSVQGTETTNEKVFEVAEVIQASSYTYLKVKENSDEKWMAVTKQDIRVGDVYYYEGALQMTNFHSKDLDRTFEEVYFISQISKKPSMMDKLENMGGPAEPKHSGKIETKQKSAIKLEKSDSEMTIAEVFANRDKYSGKEIEIRGVVVKVNKEIMGRNWIHIQDGTSSDGKFDLTITSQDLAQVNDEVTFKGVITLEKDFGAGYFYDVIMEDASLTNKVEAGATM